MLQLYSKNMYNIENTKVYKTYNVLKSFFIIKIIKDADKEQNQNGYLEAQSVESSDKARR